jgi:DNA sulfur modification protein DndB
VIEGTIEGHGLPRETIKRLSPYVTATINPLLREEYETEGWVVDKKLKKSIRMRRLKSHDVAFEDRVWAMFSRLGFTKLNRGRDFMLSYGENANETKQIDVIAWDDDVIVVVECKSSSAERPPSNSFKSEIEAIKGYRDGILRVLRAEFPGRKVKFVLATNNIVVSGEAVDRIESAKVAYLDEEAVDYYLELSEHIGKAAKYQLLGNLFQGTKISGMESLVPAIQGRMGGHTYYSFAIQPARLLKIAYVLHRSKANDQWMPTYQRIIKKARLKKVAAFVDGGGFFPNSLVLSLESGGGRLQFDRASSQDGESKLGLLHLPQLYRSAFVIDGQHRLYGYADSEYSETELVPVVAFVDLPAEAQVDLFMQINENQQAVPKNLRNTLNSDLLWHSPDFRQRSRALRLKVSQALGEEKSSPLRGRIVVGEDKITAQRCISIDAVSRGIDKGRFIGTFSATAMKEPGSFYRGANQPTLKPLTSFLEKCFEHLRTELPQQWNLGRSGFVFTNNGVEAILRLLGDIVDQLILEGTIDPRMASPEDVFAHTRPMLEPLTGYITALSLDQGAELKGMYGSAAATKYWRHFQEAVSAVIPTFKPDGLAEYLDNQVQKFNTDSFAMIRDLEKHLKDDVRRRLEDHLGATWYKDGVPQAVFQEATTLAASKQWSNESDDEVTWWDCLYLTGYQKIFQYKQDIWTNAFANGYTAPSDKGGSQSWKSKTAWMDRLIKIRNTNAHGDSVTEDDYEFLNSLHTWLVVGAGSY